MLEQELTRSILEDVPPGDPRYAQLAGLIRQRTQQIELQISFFSHAGFPSPAVSRSEGGFQRGQESMEFRLAPQFPVLFSFEGQHTHFFLPEQQPVQFRLIVQQ